MNIIGIIILAIFLGLIAAIGVLCIVICYDDAFIEQLMKEQERENDY